MGIFKITGCKDYEGATDYVFLSDYAMYDYTRDAGDKFDHSGTTSLHLIDTNQSKVSWEEYADFEDAVKDYVININAAIRKEKKKEIKFEILNKLDNSQYEYKMFRGGKWVAHGTSSYSDWEKVDEGEEWHDAMMNAWSDAVRDFLSKNGIEIPSDKPRKLINDIREKIPHGDDNIPDFEPLVAPTIATAIPEIKSDPCKFINDLMTACKKGPVNPLDLIMYTRSATKNNVKLAKDKLVNGMSTILGVVTKPVLDKAEECVNYFAELDAAQEEYRKKYTDAINIYNVCMDEAEPSEVDGLATAANTSTETVNESVTPEQSTTNVKNENVKKATTAPEVVNQILSNSSMTSIPTKYQELADKAFYARNSGTKISSTILNRYQSYYSELFKPTFSKYGVPLPMSILSIIESGANPMVNNGAENSATAKGMWQFTRTTGWEWKLLQLEPINGSYPNQYAAKNRDWVIVPGTDKRSDAALTTTAAAKLLKNLHNINYISNWLLVAAAYNCGQGNLKKYINNAGGTGANFWTIFDNIAPLETRNYILLLIKYSQVLGFNTDELFR